MVDKEKLIDTVKPTELPEKLEFFADSQEQIDESMNRDGLRAKVEAAFKEAIRRAKTTKKG